ncbi:MAG: hypothetical protein ACRBFS_03515 [Aureispira sp.]
MICHLHFPIGYQTENIHNDNLDMHVILRDGTVYFLILITLENIQSLMAKEELNLSSYFWIEDMLIVKDLSLDRIKVAIKEVVAAEQLEQIGDKIGTVASVFGSEAPYHRWHLVE